MHMRFFKYLSVQLVFAAIVPILIASTTISVPMIDVRRGQLLEQAHLRLAQAGRTIEVIYAERLTFAQLFADLLVERPALLQSVQAGDFQGMQAFVSQTRGDTLFDLVTIVSADGTILAQDGMVALWQADAAITATPTFWGMPGVGLVILITAPITSADEQLGMFIGHFVIDDAFLMDMRPRTEMDQSILLGNQLVASSLPNRFNHSAGSLRSDAVDAAVLQTGMPTVVEIAIAEVPYLVRYKPLRQLDGQVIGMIEVLLPLAPVRAAQNQATMMLLVITFCAVGAAILPGWLLVRRFSSPVRRLADATEAMGQHGLAHPVHVPGPMEVQILNRAIEQMRQQLHATYTALEAEKARYANILESVEEAIITLDANECVTSLNRSATSLLGWEHAAARGLPLGELVRLEPEQGLTLAHIPPVGTVQLTIRTHADQVLTVSATRSRFVRTPAVDDLAREHIVVLRDISEEAAVGRLKEEFLANITHEFRTPLAALTVSLEMLCEEEEPLSPAERQQMLTTSAAGVRRLDTLVRNLLDSASMQAGYFRVDPVACQLPPLIDEAVETMRPLLQERMQTIALELPEGLPPVLADDRRIVQVLVNLLSNASKFGPRGDTIQITLQFDPAEVTIGVTDHGPGIAPSRRPHLFQRFLRPGAETVRAQGIGLGLAIVKAIIERHGGHMSVRSNRAHGTTFAFTLPRVTGGLFPRWPDAATNRRVEHDHYENSPG